ncbi:hypothetical protein ES319_D11G301800v1 [Gossypium barbadense]|uniref:Pectinesterase inhibitor domain-containing protein n=1 Tax=Gossypium barbadense TaxID=3634 RepID=A0A5J5PH47_GOSBA|nr:hypothetical protein ES319_D11G301800v1 [Gossypium barbadense]
MDTLQVYGRSVANPSPVSPCPHNHMSCRMVRPHHYEIDDDPLHKQGNTFNQNIKGSSVNITALTQITIEQALNNSTNTHSFIFGLLSNTTDPAEKNALTTCENAYRLVTSNFNEATMHFFEGDYGSMLDSERRSPRAQESCITIFSTPPTPPNPVADRNRQMRILIAMAVVTGMELTTKLS